ncbi:MAG TPA: RraA family protein [Methylomirabilota bacterium]|nr:RraA family protein [Methylomirabilota bacterium]
MDGKLIGEARRHLYSGVISDVLDGLGHMHHAMAPNVRPLDETLVLFGRARTGLYMPVYHVEAGINPYEWEIALVDDLKPDDVAVLACPPGNRIGPWGELLSTAARARGAAGAVTDGLARDVKLIREMRFPVFCGGIGPLDSKGRGMVMKIDVPVDCGGVAVSPGDWIFADIDGVCVIPAALVEKTVKLALEKVSQETTVREELARGDLLKTVFARHGIL